MNLMRLKEKVAQNEFDAILLEDPVSRRYFSGFASTAGMLLVLSDKAYFLTDFRYLEAAKQRIKDCKILEITSDNYYTQQIAKIIKEENIKTLAFESQKTTVSKYEMLKENFDCDFVSCDDMLSDLRRIKSEKELEHVISAQRISEKAFEEILNFIEIGKTEKQIAAYLTYLMLSYGAEAMSFEPIVVSGVNSSKPHGVPSDKKICDGEFITMDFGSVYEGFCSDMTRTVAVGSVSEKMEQVYEIVLAAQKRAIKKAVLGAACKDVDYAARKYIADMGYGKDFGHSTGHGIGAAVHEMPSVSSVSDDKLQVGDIISAEPGIYLPSKFGVRIEDMLYIGQNETLNLTNTPKNLNIL